MMELNTSDIFKIGVDRWFVSCLGIDYPETLKQTKFSKNGDLKEGISESYDGFTIHSYSRLTQNNELLPTVTTMEFNPNRVLDGHNLYNSQVERTMKALEIVTGILKEKGIKLYLGDCIVETAEINVNIPVSFQKLKDVLDLEFNIISKGKSKLTLGDNPDYCIKNRREEESIWWKNHSNSYRTYDKTKELFEKHNLEIGVEVTRKEYIPSSYKFKEIFKSEGLDLKFSTVLLNFRLIEKFFIEFWEEALKNSFKYLETKYYSSLERKYLGYKRSREQDRKRKEIDPTFKIPRGIYKFLKENCQIFDKQYILKIIEQNEKNHPKRELEKAFKEFGECNGLKYLEYLMNFFSALKYNHGRKI
ncbi:MAG: hypothetical protein ACRCU6_00215 [Fusobacteriaceae bacterium]